MRGTRNTPSGLPARNLVRAGQDSSSLLFKPLTPLREYFCPARNIGRTLWPVQSGRPTGSGRVCSDDGHTAREFVNWSRIRVLAGAYRIGFSPSPAFSISKERTAGREQSRFRVKTLKFADRSVSSCPTSDHPQPEVIIYFHNKKATGVILRLYTNFYYVAILDYILLTLGSNPPFLSCNSI